MLSSNTSRLQTAAWRIALWTTLACGVGTALVLCVFEFSIARTIALWNKGWLIAESAAITRIAEQYAATSGRQTAAVGFMELLSSQFSAHSQPNTAALNTVFVLVRGADGREKASVGLANSGAFLEAARVVRVGNLCLSP